MNNKKTIFLSGPMRGVPRNEALGWRKYATKKLNNNFKILHAYRGRELRETFEDPRAAIARDKDDIINSDILLINDTFQNASMIGTSMETIFAWQLNKIIIIFGNSHENDYWLNYHSHIRVKDIDEACKLLNKMFK